VPGVVPSLHAAVLAFAEAGEGVIVQPPVYFPFFSAVTATGRTLLENPLRCEHGRYRIDFDHLEACAAKAKLLLLCSPHNPVGRVWDAGELRELLRIADKHGLTVLSDEIHHDLVYPGQRHIPLATLGGENVVTAVAPSKTFNIPGLGLSALIAPDPGRREKLRRAFDLLHVVGANPFSTTAFTAAYRHGGPWLDALMAYLAESRNEALALLNDIPGIAPVRPEGTYLLWLDCRALCREHGLDDAALNRFFIEKAGLGLSPGTLFGQGGSGYTRLNLGAPKAAIREAILKLGRAVETLGRLH
jgi:cystathionine beta-lyase